MSLISATMLLIRGGTSEDRRFLEEVLLPAAKARTLPETVYERMERWQKRTGIKLNLHVRGYEHMICAARTGLAFDGAKETPAYHLLKRAHRLVYSLQSVPYRRRVYGAYR